MSFGQDRFRIPVNSLSLKGCEERFWLVSTLPSRPPRKGVRLGRGHAGPTRGAVAEQAGGEQSVEGTVPPWALRAAGTACPRPSCSRSGSCPRFQGRAEPGARRSCGQTSAPSQATAPSSLASSWVTPPLGATAKLGEGPGCTPATGGSPEPSGSPRPPGRQWWCRGLASRVATVGRAAGRPLQP